MTQKLIHREHLIVRTEELAPLGRVPKGIVGLPPEQVTVIRSTEHPGFEAWDVKHSRRLWTVYHTLPTFCVAEGRLPPGEQLWRYRGELHSLTQDATMILQPGEVHQTLRLRSADFVVIRIDQERLEGLSNEELAVAAPCFSSGQLDDAQAAALMRKAARGFIDATLDPVGVDELLVSFLERLRELGGRPPGPGPARGDVAVRRAVDRARQYLHDSYATRVTLDQVAKAAEVSRAHLARSFHQTVGLSLHRYLTHVRLGHALHALRQGTMPRDVADQVGFSDQAHLTRLLKRQLGMTPAWYRSASVLR